MIKINAFTVGIMLVSMCIIAVPAGSGSQVEEAEAHLRKACEIVWKNTSKHKVERCTKRVMAALSRDNRLRDNELKRLLVASERELDTCRQELAHAREEKEGAEQACRKPES